MTEANTTDNGTDNGTTDSKSKMGTLKAFGIVAGAVVGLTAAVVTIALACTATRVEDDLDVASENLDTTPDSVSEETQGDA